eukprot:1157982-Pelagomonas_calceolata.AAC.4
MISSAWTAVTSTMPNAWTNGCSSKPIALCKWGNGHEGGIAHSSFFMPAAWTKSSASKPIPLYRWGDEGDEHGYGDADGTLASTVSTCH